MKRRKRRNIFSFLVVLVSPAVAVTVADIVLLESSGCCAFFSTTFSSFSIMRGMLWSLRPATKDVRRKSSWAAVFCVCVVFPAKFGLSASFVSKNHKITNNKQNQRNRSTGRWCCYGVSL